MDIPGQNTLKFRKNDLFPLDVEEWIKKSSSGVFLEKELCSIKKV